MNIIHEELNYSNIYSVQSINIEDHSWPPDLSHLGRNREVSSRRQNWRKKGHHEQVSDVKVRGRVQGAVWGEGL